MKRWRFQGIPNLSEPVIFNNDLPIFNVAIFIDFLSGPIFLCLLMSSSCFQKTEEPGLRRLWCQGAAVGAVPQIATVADVLSLDFVVEKPSAS